MKTTSLIRFVLLLAVLCPGLPAVAQGLNLPYGTLNRDFSITTRLGTFPNLIRTAPLPAPDRFAPGYRQHAIFILDFNTARGYVTAPRILRSTGSREVDNILMNTLQQWRIQPRTIYKLHVPVTITSRGRFVFGE